MEIIMSGHALEQARERGVSINEIKETIQKGIKLMHESKIISIYRHIKIVFKKVDEKYFVIIVMIRKEQNGE